MNLNDEIAKVAYELYEKSGCMEGRDIVNWLQAEIIVIARHMRQEAEGREETTAGEAGKMKKPIIAPAEEKSEKIKPARKAGRAKKAAVKEKKKAPQKEPVKAAKKGTRKKEQ